MRALALGADFLVTHPGSAKGTTVSAAMRTCIESLRQAAKGLRMNGLMVLIENTAGQGAASGRTFEEVAEIMRGAGRDCLSAHALIPRTALPRATPSTRRKDLAQTVKQSECDSGLEKCRS